MTVSRIVFLVHGLHQGPKKALPWMNSLRAFLEAPGVEIRLHRYGWLSGTAIRLPGLGAIVRRRHVRGLQKAVEKAARENPGAVLDVVGHSFGTYLAWMAMTQEGKAPRAFWRRVCLMAGIVSSREDFKKEAGHFEKVLNLYSREDEVVRFSTFGQVGWRGFQQADGVQVVNMDFTPYEHSDYNRPGAAWRAVREFLMA